MGARVHILHILITARGKPLFDITTDLGTSTFLNDRPLNNLVCKFTVSPRYTRQRSATNRSRETENVAFEKCQ